MQDKRLYEDLSSPSVTTNSVFKIIAIAHEGQHAAVVDIGTQTYPRVCPCA